MRSKGLVGVILVMACLLTSSSMLYANEVSVLTSRLERALVDAVAPLIGARVPHEVLTEEMHKVATWATFVAPHKYLVATDDVMQTLAVGVLDGWLDTYCTMKAGEEPPLCGYLINHLKNALRKERDFMNSSVPYVPMHERIMQPLPQEHTPLARLGFPHQDTCLLLGKDLLTSEQRDLLRGRYQEGRTVKELAQARGESPSKVSRKLTETRQCLGKVLRLGAIASPETMSFSLLARMHLSGQPEGFTRSAASSPIPAA